ncbi:MAG: DinB family protein [Candidatus Binatia bacterium]
MNEDLTLLARYNTWANTKVFELCASAGESELLRAEGYQPVPEILRHLVHVESNFLRMSLDEERVPVDAEPLPALAARCAGIDAGYERLAADASPEDLGREFHVPWFGFDVTVREAILQALTHSQKHRADVCMLLPSVGVDAPGLDLIQWLAESRGRA